MRYAIADGRISKKCLRSLENLAESIVLLPPLPSLDVPVASHPDMLIWVCGKQIVAYADYYKIAKPQLDTLASAGFELLLANEQTGRTYPDDVHLNCALVGNHIICLRRSVSETISAIAERRGLTLVNTRQGYAKCATAVVSENAVITSDRAIYRSASKAGIDTLLIREGSVRLDGYGTGFLGGATGTVRDALLFCGSLDSHPDAAQIREFCKVHGKRAVSLSDEPLYDFGTVFFLE